LGCWFAFSSDLHLGRGSGFWRLSKALRSHTARGTTWYSGSQLFDLLLPMYISYVARLSWCIVVRRSSGCELGFSVVRWRVSGGNIGRHRAVEGFRTFRMLRAALDIDMLTVVMRYLDGVRGRPGGVVAVNCHDQATRSTDEGVAGHERIQEAAMDLACLEAVGACHQNERSGYCARSHTSHYQPSCFVNSHCLSETYKATRSAMHSFHGR
jgi:hypothetical protein